VNAEVAATLVSLQVGLPRTVKSSEEAEHVWTTGFFKTPTTLSLWLGRLNLDGDGQADLQNHGGPEKAVNVYPAEHYPYWAQTIGLADLQPGSFGENFTIEGLLESDVCIGDVFEVGDALIQVSQPRQPCWKLARRWRIKDLALRVQETGRTGWYFRVLREGHVQAGHTLALRERLCPQWTVAAANEIMHDHKGDADTIQNLADCSYLASRWQTKLKRRALTGIIEDQSARLEGPLRGS
jgi:MOSC domain-containing protein YiiM